MRILLLKNWALVQDLRPFGYRIEKTYRSRILAQREARYYRLLFIIPIGEALAYNARVKDSKEFEKELMYYEDHQ